MAAALVGFGTLFCSFRAACVLLAFYFSSSALTQFKEEEKAKLEEDHKKGGQRDWRQVLCNAGVPTVLAVATAAVGGLTDLPLSTAAEG